MRILFLTIFITFIPLVVFGADNFFPLAPIPGITETEPESLGQYINNIFNLAITIGAILAVLRIITAGFQYITTEAVGEKKNSREIIAQAILGLVLLMSVTLILNLINKDITNLSVLNFDELRNNGALTAPADPGVLPSGSSITIVRDSSGNIIEASQNRLQVFESRCSGDLVYGDVSDALVSIGPSFPFVGYGSRTQDVVCPGGSGSD